MHASWLSALSSLWNVIIGYAMQAGMSIASGSKQVPGQLVGAGCRARHPPQPLLRAVAASLVNLGSNNTSGQDQGGSREAGSQRCSCCWWQGSWGCHAGMMPTAAAMVHARADGNAFNQELLGATGAVDAVVKPATLLWCWAAAC